MQTHRSWITLFGLWTILATPGAARQLVQAPAPLRVAKVAVPLESGSFTGAEQRIGFGELGSNASVAGYLDTHGVWFELAGGGLPTIWLDPELRNAKAAESKGLIRPGKPPTAGGWALRVERAQAGAWPAGAALSPPAPTTLPDEAALRIDFAGAVSRVGFHARSVETRSLTLVVSCLAEGVVLGTQCFGLSPSYRFVGIESSVAFDQLRLDLVNPDLGTFSLDELRFEADLADEDADGVPTFADVCPLLFDPDQRDADGDGLGDRCDAWPLDPENDADGDLVDGRLDVCPTMFDPQQLDSDGDGIGDACDPLPLALDSDGDGVPDTEDNCPFGYNPPQTDCDGDGIGDVCDPVLVEPGNPSLTLARGESVVLSGEVCLPPVPPRIDIVVCVDTTGSMGEEIANVQIGLRDFIHKTRHGTSSDLRYAFVSFRDYPRIYAGCGYAMHYGVPGDLPFVVEAPFGSEDFEIIAAINALAAGGGADVPESYARVVWELGQPDSGINWRNGSARYAILVLDDIPHDCDVQGGTSGCPIGSTTGIDPGRDELISTPDDVDFQDSALPALLPNATKLVTIYSNGTSLAGYCAWTQWSESTGGLAVRIDPDGSLPPDLDIPRTVLDLIGEGHVEGVEFVEEPGCPLEVTFEPPGYPQTIDVTVGQKLPFQETIRVPADLDPSITQLTCTISFVAEGALVATQTIDVTVE